MTSVVVDASMAATWLLPDEWSADTITILRDLPKIGAIVPSLFRYEIRNIIVLAQRRNRIDVTMAGALMRKLDELPLSDGGYGEDAAILSIAITHSLTAYDATYLAMARSTASGLATLDKRLAAAARKEGIDLFGPLAP